jgi:hypothetical protein
MRKKAFWIYQSVKLNYDSTGIFAKAKSYVNIAQVYVSGLF